MISGRLLCMAGLLAGAACCSVPGVSSQDRKASDHATAAPDQLDQASESGREDSTGSRSTPSLSAEDLAAAVRERINGVVFTSQRSLEEVEASCETARTHVSTLVAQLTELRIAAKEAGSSGDALAALDGLEQDAIALNENLVTLLSDLKNEQAGVEKFYDHLSEMERPVVNEAGEVAEEKAPRIPWRQLDAEVSTYEGSGSLQKLLARSDRLARGGAVLVARFDQVEREFSSSLGLDVVARASSSSESSPETSPLRDAFVADEVGEALSPKGEIAEIRTSEGVLLLEFLPEDAPEHVRNFKRLVREGFYDNLTFHRVLPGYVIQGGCPRGDGSGGPGWQVDNEFNTQRHRRGTLSMARFAHPDSAGSQFFICLDDRPELNGKQTVFGRVIRGEATLQAMEALADPNGTGTPSKVIEINQIILRSWEEGDNEPRMIAGNPVR